MVGCDRNQRRTTIACNGAGGGVGFEIIASRAGPLLQVVRPGNYSILGGDESLAGR